MRQSLMYTLIGRAFSPRPGEHNQEPNADECLPAGRAVPKKRREVAEDGAGGGSRFGEQPVITEERERTERLQIMLSKDELAAIDEFRFENRMPTRAAGVRELLRRGLLAAKSEGPPREH
jgi:hypothetical protein